MKVKSLSRVRLFATPWTVAYQAPLSMGFSRQEYWGGLPFPPKFTAPLPVSLFTPPDRDRRVDSHVFLQGVPDVPREPPDEAGLMRKFEK